MLRRLLQWVPVGRGSLATFFLFLLAILVVVPTAAQEPKGAFALPELSTGRFIAAPVVVTAEMNKANVPVYATYTLKDPATVQVHVFGLDKAKRASAEPRRAKAGETIVETLRPWRQITDNKEGTYLLVYAVLEKDASRRTFADVGILEGGAKEGSRFDKFEVAPDAGMLFKITYFYCATLD